MKFQLLLLFALVAFALADGKGKMHKEIGPYKSLGYINDLDHEQSGNPVNSVNPMYIARLKRDVKNGDKKEKIGNGIGYFAPHDEITVPWRMSTNQMANARLKRDVKNGDKKEKIDKGIGYLAPTDEITVPWREPTNAMNNARPKRDMIEWHARYGSAYPYPAAVRIQYPISYAAPWPYYSAGAPFSYPVRAAYNPEVFYNSFGYYPA